MKTQPNCSICGTRVDFDYIVSDSFWNEIVPPGNHSDIICMRCLDEMATLKDKNICEHIDKIYYHGIGKTLILNPNAVTSYVIVGNDK